MRPRSAWSSAYGARFCRWLAVALMLVGQLYAGAEANAGRHATLSALEAATIFCHAGPAGHDHAPPLRQHVADPAIVQASASLACAAAILSPPPVLPAPSACLAGPGFTQAARAPPARLAATPPATGPPASV